MGCYINFEPRNTGYYGKTWRGSEFNLPRDGRLWALEADRQEVAFSFQPDWNRFTTGRGSCCRGRRPAWWEMEEQCVVLTWHDVGLAFEGGRRSIPGRVLDGVGAGEMPRGAGQLRPI